jgi:predicted porin
MKKSLIALAVAGAFAAPAAMAEVTISGAINLGIAMIDSDDGRAAIGGAEVAGSGQNRTSLASNYSNVNISSSDDIGNGNRIVLNLQIDAGAINNTNSFNNRNSYLGIEGGWGSFKMGTNENVYERWMYESDPLDGAMGIGGNIQMLGNHGFQGGGWFDVGNGQNGPDNGSFWRRTHHTIWYNSPVIARGITFEVDYTLNAFKSATTDPQVLSMGVQWKPEGSPFFLNAAYESHTDMGVVANGTATAPTVIFANADATGMQFGGGITLGSMLITARYEQLEWEDTAGTGTLERDHIWAGLKWSLPSGYVGAEFGMAMEADLLGAEVPDSAATMIGLGYFHNLSKQSQMYVVGTMISNDDNANYGIGAGTGSTGGLGSDHTGITVGIKHVF